MWHSRLARLESEAQDLERPEDAADQLAEVQRLHSQLATQAERRTALIGKVRGRSLSPYRRRENAR